jgi:hypothetical protein
MSWVKAFSLSIVMGQYLGAEVKNFGDSEKT